MQFVPVEIVNISQLQRLAGRVRRYWKVAHRLRHILSWSLQECIDELLAIAEACDGKSIFPNPHLEAVIKGFRPWLERRKRDFILLRPNKRRILLKLLALRCWIGDRSIRRLPLLGVNVGVNGLTPWYFSGKQQTTSSHHKDGKLAVLAEADVAGLEPGLELVAHSMALLARADLEQRQRVGRVHRVTAETMALLQITSSHWRRQLLAWYVLLPSCALLLR